MERQDQPWVEPVTLAGARVLLRPLAPADAGALAAAVQDGELWRLWYTSAPRPQQMESEIARRLALQDAGSMLPFAVLERGTGEPVGMTSYLHLDAANRRLEIGATWLAQRVQRTGLNTEAKLLLLAHAFDRLGSIAVEFRTHSMNYPSRAAIERLGARLDGVLRSHMVLPNGTLRDTCVYSIVAPEWPAVRAHLQWQMERRG